MMNIVQGTLEWKALRRTKITATDAAVVLGVSPWKTPLTLWEEKTNGTESTFVSPRMQRGLDLEPMARDYFFQEIRIEMFPKVVISPEIDWAMASMDGVSINGQHALEIKCPGYVDHASALDGKIPDKYFPQLQHQMFVCQLESIFYLSFDGFSGKIIELKRDDKYIENMLTEEEEFYFYIKNHLPPPCKDKDYIKKDDEEWNKAVIEYINDFNEKKRLEDRLEQKRQWLIAQAGDLNVMGAGIKLSKCTRKGTVDYAKIPQLNGIDLEPYRKESVVTWTIRT